MMLIGTVHALIELIDSTPEKAALMLSGMRENGEIIANLLVDITMQQSEELKDIK